ncbi:MAG TPA: histidine phosphatase family protein [Polyangiaceae bacterium]
MRVLYLARHGETEWNALGKLQGANDVPLNDRGRAQAKALGEALAGEGIVRVMASDLSRARQTVEIAAAVLGIGDLALDAELRERAFGPFEGLTRLECEAKYPEAWAAWTKDSVIPEGGEHTHLVVARMKRAILRCLDRGGPMLVVSHGGAMRLVLNELTGRTHEPIGNGVIYRLEERDGVYDVRAFVPARE